jgi:hypothetical protein
MPIGSKVHKIFKALVNAGHPPASAARIAQHATGLALATGKKPKHQCSKCSK